MIVFMLDNTLGTRGSWSKDPSAPHWASPCLSRVPHSLNTTLHILVGEINTLCKCVVSFLYLGLHSYHRYTQQWIRLATPLNGQEGFNIEITGHPSTNTIMEGFFSVQPEVFWPVQWKRSRSREMRVIEWSFFNDLSSTKGAWKKSRAPGTFQSLQFWTSNQC
jgi:hypothetical protein